MSKLRKRTNKELHKNILKALRSTQLTLNEISKKAGIYWPNTKHQLILLKGNDMVKEVFRHARLRIFEITEQGLRYLKDLER